MARIDIETPSTGGGGGGGNLQLSGGASMTATLTSVTDTSNTASPLKLSTTIVQITSPLRITTSDASGFYLDAEDSATNNRFSIKRDPSAQDVTLDFASNPSGSTTLVGAIRTFRDGVNLSAAMSFIEDGSIGIGTSSPSATFDVHSAAAVVSQFNKTISGNSYIQQLTAGSAKWKHGFTSSTGAYDIIDDVNNLTRLGVLNTGQLRLNAYTSTGAFTGTTAGFLAFDTSGNILSVTSPATSPAGTTGAVQFNNAGAFGADSANFFWNDTNNYLGIGTNAPASALNFGVNSYITYNNLSSNSFIGEFGINDCLGLQITGNNPIRFLTDSTERVRIFGNGNTAFGSNADLGARLGIKGSGSTSATTALLVQNSSGVSSLQVNDKGSVFNLGKGSIGSNTVFGLDALQANTTGSQNTVMGLETLYSNTTGLSNSAFGLQSMFSNTTGGNNTAMGVGALISNITGSSNSALGVDTQSGNFSGSLILGRDATATANNQCVFGSAGTNAGAVVAEVNTSANVWNVVINGVAHKILLA